MMKLITTIFLSLSFLCNFPVTSQEYDLEEVLVTPYSDVINRTGKLDFKRTLSLSFKSQGYLKRLSVDEGDYFDEKSVLASLDVSELQATKNASYAQLLNAKQKVERVTALYKSNLSSIQELDAAKTEVETLRSVYKIAFYNLEKAQIIAPFSGVVLNRFTELGELQSPGTEVLKVAALENNWVVKVALSGNEISQVRLGQQVKVQLRQLGEVEGVITKIPAIATSNGNLFIVEVLISQLEKQVGVIAGQMAQVTFAFSNENLVYRMPLSALINMNDLGQAVVMTQGLGNKKFQYQAFDVYKIDNDFVYLTATIDSQPLQIVTQGWQHLTISN